ncbi:PHP domain-containing protein [Gracilibacillus halophilus YIM-C55.5]|uniref:PHP domain-containing protein n=1 Tax=Gracilibacillus halophilus YIM-C55.5 TaxID=1308866 RepID=N4WQX6_9BACI|nr:PHP domain-containing protein [Gracilibacillus halophilus]ENH96850.1 PHP domain-containing protein [Gracilibacillus halophilus YIM-C55.5]
MKIDFHSHVKISKQSMFHPAYFQEMMEEAKAAGLTAIAMTEHFNTIRFFDIYDYLDEHYSYMNGYYSVEGMQLFPGMEVDVQEGGHILLIGSREEILHVRHQLTGHLESSHFIGFDRLMELARASDLFTIGAHPYRESTPLAKHVSMKQLKQLDALDLNGKDLYKKGVITCQKELEQLAKETGLPIVGGSDTHQFIQYGSIMNQFDQTYLNHDQLREAVQNRKHRVQVSDDVSLKVRSATLIKKYMKKYLQQKQEHVV